MIALYRYSKKKSQENNETKKKIKIYKIYVLTKATCRYTKTLIYTYVMYIHMYNNNKLYIH